MKIYDITYPLRHDIAVWPGDTPFSFDVNWTIEQSGSVNVGKLTMSTHTGTHVDAPFHFEKNGMTMEQAPLDVYVGPARVIDMSGVPVITKDELLKHDLSGVVRLLIKTNSWSDTTQFPSTITYIAPDAAAYFGELGVRLVGLDVPSVDPVDSKELPAHHALAASHVYILEGAVLADVPVGDYELIALPLKITGGDASPVRAILKK